LVVIRIFNLDQLKEAERDRVLKEIDESESERGEMLAQQREEEIAKHKKMKG
jgi:hypothetical protein